VVAKHSDSAWLIVVVFFFFAVPASLPPRSNKLLIMIESLSLGAAMVFFGFGFVVIILSTICTLVVQEHVDRERRAPFAIFVLPYLLEVPRRSDVVERLETVPK